MIAIIDYGVGNLFSLVCSFKNIGVETVVTDDPEVIRAADMLLKLPVHKMQMYILLIVRGTAIDFFRKEHRNYIEERTGYN